MKKLKRQSCYYEWQQKAREGGACQKCGHKFTTLTVDHIVPVAILESIDVTGEAKYEDAENFQLLCAICNQMKAHRLDLTNPKTKILLRRYLCWHDDIVMGNAPVKPVAASPEQLEGCEHGTGKWCNCLVAKL